jgi:hypothetical protein
VAEGAATVVVGLRQWQVKDQDGKAQLETRRDRRKRMGSSFSPGMALRQRNPACKSDGGGVPRSPTWIRCKDAMRRCRFATKAWRTSELIGGRNKARTVAMVALPAFSWTKNKVGEG